MQPGGQPKAWCRNQKALLHPPRTPLQECLQPIHPGLPVLYRTNGGGTKEIVGVAGYEFRNTDDFMKLLNLSIKNYQYLISNIDKYKISRQGMYDQYMLLFRQLHEQPPRLIKFNLLNSLFLMVSQIRI